MVHECILENLVTNVCGLKDRASRIGEFVVLVCIVLAQTSFNSMMGCKWTRYIQNHILM